MMSSNPKCKKCSSKSLIYNLWGMPDEEVIKELKSDGFQVEIHGCVPPLADQECFLFECKKCGYKYGDPFKEE